MTHIYVIIYVIIVSNNGLLPVWYQDIKSTNADLLSTGPAKTNFKSQQWDSHSRKCIQIVVCKMSAILSWVNMLTKIDWVHLCNIKTKQNKKQTKTKQNKNKTKQKRVILPNMYKWKFMMFEEVPCTAVSNDMVWIGDIKDKWMLITLRSSI